MRRKRVSSGDFKARLPTAQQQHISSGEKGRLTNVTSCFGRRLHETKNWQFKKS